MGRNKFPDAAGTPSRRQLSLPHPPNRSVPGLRAPMFMHESLIAMAQRPTLREELPDALAPPPPPPPSAPHKAMLDHFHANLSYPVQPGGDLCMASPATVVLDDGDAAAATVPLASLTKIGTLQLMVTDVDVELLAFHQLTGRNLAAVHVLGFEEGGVVSRELTEAIRLPVVEVGEHRYLFAKSALGQWLLPEPGANRTLVLAAEAQRAIHLDMVDATGQALVATGHAVGQGAAAAGTAMAPAWEAAGGAMGRGLDAAGKAIGPAWEATATAVGQGAQEAGGAMGRGLDEAGKAIGPAWEKTAAATTNAVRGVPGKVGPAWESSKQLIGEGVDGMGKAIGPAWEATATAVGQAVTGAVRLFNAKKQREREGAEGQPPEEAAEAAESAQSKPAEGKPAEPAAEPAESAAEPAAAAKEGAANEATVVD